MQGLLDLYSDYLLSTFDQATATGLSKLMEGAVSHDQVSRLLSGQSFSSKDLWIAVKPLVKKHQTEEGCLSVPDIYETVERAERVTVKALDKDGKEFTLEADGLLAVCIQHEMDHLMGNLFVDYLSPLKQMRVKKKIQKARRQAAII